MTHIIKLSFTLLCLIFSPLFISAQDYLSLEEAMRLGLEKNFDVFVAQKSIEQSKNNYTRGNAGFLPRVDIDASHTGSITNSQINFLDGRSQNVDGAKNNSSRAGISATWTIFDGLVMFDRYNQLGLNREIANLNLRFQMEFVSQQILNTYYAIVQNEKTLAVLRQNLLVSQNRVDIAKDRYELGVFSKMDLLRAEVDRNNDSTLVINQKQAIFEAKTVLNNLLNRAAETDFAVADTIELRSEMNYETLKQNINTKNTSVLLSKRNLSFSELDLKMSKGNTLPRVDIDLGYDFSRSKSGSGFVSSNRNRGFSYGIRLTYNLFNGNNRKREIANAQINREINREAIGTTQNQVAADYEIAYKDYQRNLELYELEKYNADVAQQNLDIAIEKYKLGGMSALDFRDIQQASLDATNRVLIIQFQIKVSEVELLRIAGELVRNN